MVPGEHDAGLDGGALYRQFFGDSSYSFDHRGVHFVALDNVSRPLPEVGAERIAWLRKDLARYSATTPIVHAPASVPPSTLSLSTEEVELTMREHSGTEGFQQLLRPSSLQSSSSSEGAWRGRCGRRRAARTPPRHETRCSSRCACLMLGRELDPHHSPRERPPRERLSRAPGRARGRDTIALADADGGTDVLAVHDGLPRGLPTADNEAGWRSSLAKLAALVEAG